MSSNSCCFFFILGSDQGWLTMMQTKAPVSRWQTERMPPLCWSLSNKWSSLAKESGPSLESSGEFRLDSSPPKSEHYQPLASLREDARPPLISPAGGWDEIKCPTDMILAFHTVLLSSLFGCSLTSWKPSPTSKGSCSPPSISSLCDMCRCQKDSF